MIINLVILNFSPLIWYETKRMIQLAVHRGPMEPKDLISFLKPMLEELKTLQNEGFHVQGHDGKIYHVQAHLLQGNVWLEESKKMAKTVPEIQS